MSWIPVKVLVLKRPYLVSNESELYSLLSHKGFTLFNKAPSIRLVLQTVRQPVEMSNMYKCEECSYWEPVQTAFLMIQMSLLVVQDSNQQPPTPSLLDSVYDLIEADLDSNYTTDSIKIS